MPIFEISLLAHRDDSNFSVDLPSGDLSSSDSEDEDVTSEDDASTVSSEDSESICFWIIFISSYSIS